MPSSEVIEAVAGFEAFPAAAGVFDIDGSVLALNAAARKLVGRDADQLVGRNIGELGVALLAAWRDFVAAGEHTGELAVPSPHGPRTFEYSLATRWAGTRHIVVACAMDITRHKHAERANVEHEREVATRQRLESLGLVAGGMAHELNNLLVAVVAEASVMREEATNDIVRAAIGRIDTASKRMNHLTHQLLAYTGRGRFVTQLLDPDQLLDEKREPILRRLPAGVQLDVEPGAGTVAIEADRGLLRQVIRDLVENAAEALPDGNGHVCVRSRVVADDGRSWWELEVRDSGVGMDAATQARIFDPFFSTKANRHGLGLSAILGIVRRLGGDLAVSSELGIGSKFRVRLPVVPGVAPPRRRSTSEQPVRLDMAGLRVLLADDEAIVRATVSRLLARRGAIAILATDGAEAETLLQTAKFDLVLCDVVMPKKTGYELVPIAREHQPGVPIVLMSGYSEPASVAVQPDHFLEKPFTASGLEDAIRAVMGKVRT